MVSDRLTLHFNCSAHSSSPLISTCMRSLLCSLSLSLEYYRSFGAHTVLISEIQAYLQFNSSGELGTVPLQSAQLSVLYEMLLLHGYVPLQQWDTALQQMSAIQNLHRKKKEVRNATTHAMWLMQS